MLVRKVPAAGQNGHVEKLKIDASEPLEQCGLDDRISRHVGPLEFASMPGPMFITRFSNFLRLISCPPDAARKEL